LTLLTEKAPKLNPRILILPPLDLCSLLPLLDQGVNHVPSEPADRVDYSFFVEDFLINLLSCL